MGRVKGSKETYQHTITVDGKEIGDYQPSLKKSNPLRQGKIYDDFCVLNQEFLKYIIHCDLTKNEMKILLFLLAYMDRDNKIIVDSEMINHHLKINRTHVNKYIKRLEEKKIIYKRRLGYRKGNEVLLNFDIISPHMAYKNANKQDKVVEHKQLMNAKQSPYMKQINMFGEVDYVDKDTGEVFHSSNPLGADEDLGVDS
jgi:predicted transcriptional regulator